MSRLTLRTEAVEVYEGSAPYLITCEHASQRMPYGWSWPDEDRWLIDTHWAFDLGARELSRDLALSLDGTAVLSRFSRLIVDPNRPEDSNTLFRERAEGKTIHLNTTYLDEGGQKRRIEELLRPYHEIVDREVQRSGAPVLLGLHTFTELYEGQPRSLEIGVLFDRDEALAERMAEQLAKHGIHVALNEPYSGKNGLMYSVDRHARTHERECLELEVRQDLATDPSFRHTLNAVLHEFFG